MSLITLNKAGLYCPQADMYIDPWRKVENAIITHAHSDHCRPGHANYLAHKRSEAPIYHRIGKKISLETLEYGEIREVNGVKISLHPAGHIIGSAQVRLEYKGEIWVISGDYKVEDDGYSGAFEPVKCHHFISECTFGLPVFRWKKQEEEYKAVNEWWRQNKEDGKTSVLAAYSLGKAQRLLFGIDQTIGEICTDKAIYETTNAIEAVEKKLPDIKLIDPDIPKSELKGNLVLATSSIFGSKLMSKFNPCSTAMASGWMALRGMRRRRSTDRGFVISDHADWTGLIQAIEATGADNIYLTHGYSAVFSRYLKEQGYNAQVLETAFEGESLD